MVFEPTKHGGWVDEAKVEQNLQAGARQRAGRNEFNGEGEAFLLVFEQHGLDNTADEINTTPLRNSHTPEVSLPPRSGRSHPLLNDASD